MDLTRLYNLTTPELREEAERLGVSDTYAMSRGQLIHAIRNQVSGPPPSGFLGKVMGFAKWALQAAQEEPSKSAESVSEAVPEAVSEPASVSESVSAAGSESAPVSESVPVSELVPVPESVPASEVEIVSEVVTEIVIESVTASGPPSRPPVGVFSKSAGMFEEPFPTRTMARILAEQGHFKRSLAIYAALLRDEPGNGELSREADEVRERSRARRSHVY